KSALELNATKHQNLVLKAMTDQEQIVRKLPSDLLVAALPVETPEDARIKNLLTNRSTACNSPGYPLQFKFDEAGWNKTINLMKVVANTGVMPPNPKANAIIEHDQKALAAYLARARGPGETSMKFKPRPRATGEAARVAWALY